MLLPPPNESEAHTYLLQCAARTAHRKGMSAAEWYAEQEIVEFLELNHPETFGLLKAFAEAYTPYAKLSYEHYSINGNAPMDPATQAQWVELKRRQNEAREALLRHLGLM
jgi:hypothetical protein